MRRLFFITESKLNSISDLLQEWDSALIELNVSVTFKLKGKIISRIEQEAVKQVDLTDEDFDSIMLSLTQDSSRLLYKTHLTVKETDTLFKSMSNIDMKIVQYMKGLFSTIATKQGIALVVLSA